MKKLKQKSRLGRNKLEISSVKICLCIPGQTYAAIEKETVKRSRLAQTNLKITEVIYSILNQQLFGDN